ncbi:palmitoyltransferase PFA4 [Ascoidea rubescens DSM 1968]|uniref:Palmitoyltransferase PFA4 n=1 Tax=Ascoidea rubescens DSM 1968 TaxID=1344418 RepID=A0A1D2VBP1_9ASCO|nr:Palmitoyltransferase with autoacylation activity [Ascoidea rubescens DSM 1968]ODV59046.1 Palmitoyltransferase with autoacylation activity [Ascoidea rubescens DSM 1968]
MIAKLKWPWLGIAIPSFLIAFIGYSAHFFIFRNDFSMNRQLWFEFCLSMIWLNYLLAIKVNPGSPPKFFVPEKPPIAWKRWCKKCNNYKPERSHHCQSCKQCVLKMDHHCPWTNNCVGNNNLGHFIRFLLWVDYTTFFVLVHLIKKVMYFWSRKNYPSYMINKKELTFTIILLPIDSFVFITVFILTLRCFYYTIFTGMTQIEFWEWERIESQINTIQFWEKIKKNYLSVYNKSLSLTSLNSCSKNKKNKKKLKNKKNNFISNINDIDNSDDSDNYNQDFNYQLPNFKIDDFIFPYDISPWQNFVQALNYPWLLLIPWVYPKCDGVHFKKTEDLEEDQIGLPWPPDGNNQDKNDELVRNDASPGVGAERFVVGELSVISKSKVKKRVHWKNDFGEGLKDFGVDIEAEDD